MREYALTEAYSLTIVFVEKLAPYGTTAGRMKKGPKGRERQN